MAVNMIVNSEMVIRGVESGEYDANAVMRFYNGGFITADVAHKLCSTDELKSQELDPSVLSNTGARLMNESMYCVSSESAAPGLNRAWVVALAVLERYKKEAKLDGVEIYQHKNNPECTVFTQSTLIEIGTIPTVSGKVLEEHGFLLVNKWVIGRTIQPMVIELSGVMGDDGSIGNKIASTESVLFVFPAYAYPSLEYASAMGGGRQHTGIFLPFAISRGFASLARLPDIDGEPLRILMLWIGKVDAKDGDLIDVEEFKEWMQTLPAPVAV